MKEITSFEKFLVTELESKNIKYILCDVSGDYVLEAQTFDEAFEECKESFDYEKEAENLIETFYDEYEEKFTLTADEACQKIDTDIENNIFTIEEYINKSI